MSRPLGLVFPAAAIGLGSLLLRPRRGFFPTASSEGPQRAFTAQVTLEERHTDDLEITAHPVEQGASITDHAYKRPAEVVIRCAWSNSPSNPSGLFSKAVAVGAALGGPVIGAIQAVPATLGGLKAAQSVFRGEDAGQINQVYQQLLELQASRIPFDVLTAKRAYKNMLFKSLVVTTDIETENNLMLVATCQQILIARTQVTSFNSDPSTQSDPEATQPPLNQGPRQLTEATTFLPDPETVSGAIQGLNASVEQAQNVLTEVTRTVTQSLSGALSRLPDVLGNLSTTLGDLIPQLPSPLDIPLASGPQSLSIPFSGMDFNSTVGKALEALPRQLDQVQNALIASAQQLPSVASTLTPLTTEALNSSLGVVNSMIDNTLNQLKRALPVN